MGALVLTGSTLIDIYTMLPVVLRDYESRVTSADVAAVGDVVALMSAAAALRVCTVVTVI